MNRAKYINRLGVDILIVTLCFFIARIIFPYGDVFFSKRSVVFLFYMVAFWYFASQITFLYNEFLARSLSQEIICLTKTIIVQDAFIIIALFFASRNPMEAKWFVVCFIGLQVITLPFVKYFTRWYYATRHTKGKRITSLLIIGAGELGMNFNSIICNNYQFGYKIAGFVDDIAKPLLNGQYLGKIEDLDTILQEKEVNDVIVALPNNAIEKIKYAVKVSEDNGKRVRVIPDYFRLSPSVSISTFGTLPLVSLRNIPLDNAELRFFKRVFDIVFSLLIFVFIFSWLFPIIMVLIKLNSKGAIFFVQERWGINNKKIFCYKFRSMVSYSKDVDENGNYQQATKNDARITSVGKFLRKTNLDELPQFLNVLKGEMSIVGPRPHPTPLNLHSKNTINNYMLRHLVKPGITGWAQVHGYRGETKDYRLMQKRIDFDIWYIENWSFWLDCQIIIQTVINMIKGEKNAY
jgi:putative colanic acid biosynthesis UDP-glucose lipid carrier transferase